MKGMGAGVTGTLARATELQCLRFTSFQTPSFTFPLLRLKVILTPVNLLAKLGLLIQVLPPLSFSDPACHYVKFHFHSVPKSAHELP